MLVQRSEKGSECEKIFYGKIKISFWKASFLQYN